MNKHPEAASSAQWCDRRIGRASIVWSTNKTTFASPDSCLPDPAATACGTIWADDGIRKGFGGVGQVIHSVGWKLVDVWTHLDLLGLWLCITQETDRSPGIAPPS